jgi:hypothetical protein
MASGPNSRLEVISSRSKKFDKKFSSQKNGFKTELTGGTDLRDPGRCRSAEEPGIPERRSRWTRTPDRGCPREWRRKLEQDQKIIKWLNN